MDHHLGRGYDSFVIRLWHESASGQLLRAEIDHVQTGAVHVGRQIDAAWILTTLHELVEARAQSIAGNQPPDYDDPGPAP